MPFSAAFAGLTHVELPSETFDLGGGAILRRRYGYLFSPYMLAYQPAPNGGHHPAPWSAAEGSQGYEYKVEMEVQPISDEKDAREKVWWLAFLLRIAGAPYLSVPILSNSSLEPPTRAEPTPRLIPFEPYHRILKSNSDGMRTLKSEDLEWIKSKWESGLGLIKSNPKLYAVARAFDDATIAGRAPPSLLPLWSGIETLFSQGKGEIRFRVSVFVSTYLAESGKPRLDLYKHILRLYDARSSAAHSAGKLDMESLLESYVLLRNILVRIFDSGELPSFGKLEMKLFNAE